ncbi:MAG: hypothetical protein JWQ38_2667 [Flavipsychrobacter sp.]|nr:hypothetical protein [Flavipsychrobacter sp.]
MKLNAVMLTALLLSAAPAFSQTVYNQYPCAECAVYDNNGTDLRGFINSNKDQLMARGGKVNEYSNNTWGYLQIKNAHVPSVDKQGNLNYYQSMDVTLAMYKTLDGGLATWMARETNAPQGPLVYIKTNDEGKLGLENVKYTKITHDLEMKKFALVEYYNDTYNDRDYDNLLKNYILLKSGSIKDPSGFKTVIEFYDNFLSKFTYLSDPTLETKSFVTFLSVNGTKYVGYFNIINSKLAGHLNPYKVEYEADRPVLVNSIFKKLKGNIVYIYGDDTFGMDPEMVKYARENNIKLKHWKTTATKKFNDK